MKRNTRILFLLHTAIVVSFYMFMKYFGNSYVVDFMNEIISNKEVTMDTAGNINIAAIILHSFAVVFYIKVRENLISKPPGSFSLRIIDFVYSKKVQERVFRPLLADMMEEYFQALDEGRVWKSRWIRIKTLVNLMIAVVSQISISTIKLFIGFWKVT